MKIVQTNDAGVAVLKAAGLPCVELTLTPMAQPAAPRQPTRTLTPERASELGKLSAGVPKTRRRGLIGTRHQRWNGVNKIMLGQNVPSDEEVHQGAWAYRKIHEEMRTTGKAEMSREEMRAFLGAAYELEFGKSLTSYSHLVTIMLDRGYVSPVRT